MKVFFPRNIDSGWLNLSFQIGPMRISLTQLLIVAGFASVGLAIRNQMIKSGRDKTMASIFVSPIILMGMIIAFFEISNMGLVEFIFKLIRSNFIDEPRKYQNISSDPIDPMRIAMSKMRVIAEQSNTNTDTKNQLDINTNTSSDILTDITEKSQN